MHDTFPVRSSEKSHSKITTMSTKRQRPQNLQNLRNLMSSAENATSQLCNKHNVVHNLQILHAAQCDLPPSILRDQHLHTTGTHLTNTMRNILNDIRALQNEPLDNQAHHAMTTSLLSTWTQCQPEWHQLITDLNTLCKQQQHSADPPAKKLRNATPWTKPSP